MKDKTAQAMAEAMGAKLVTEDEPKDTSNPSVDTDNSNPEGTEVNTDTDSADSTDGAGGTEGAQGTEGSSTDGTEGNSGVEQGSEGIAPDQGDDGLTIPGAKGAENTVQDQDFEKLLAERSNGRFKSLDDINKALEEAPAEAFANEQIAKLNEYVKQGGSLNDFVKTQTVDYTSMSPDQLVKEHIMMTEGLTSDEADLMIEDSFGVASGASERDKKLAEIKLKRESNKALAFLQDNQKKWSVPQGADKQAANKAIEEKWKSDLENVTRDIKTIEVALNQTDKFSYKVEADVLQKIKETIKRPEAFFSRYINSDGTENVKQFVEDMVWLDKKDEIVRSAAANNKATGKQEVLDQIKNPDFKGESKGSQSGTPLTIAQQAAKAMYGK